MVGAASCRSMTREDRLEAALPALALRDGVAPTSHGLPFILSDLTGAMNHKFIGAQFA